MEVPPIQSHYKHHIQYFETLGPSQNNIIHSTLKTSMLFTIDLAWWTLNFLIKIRGISIKMIVLQIWDFLYRFSLQKRSIVIDTSKYLASYWTPSHKPNGWL